MSTVTYLNIYIMITVNILKIQYIITVIIISLYCKGINLYTVVTLCL